jgi:hypothetical protein
MKKQIAIIILLATGILISGQGFAAEPNKAKQGNSAVTKMAKPQGMPFYRPPRRGAPQARVGGGTRGIDREITDIFALAPDHVGLTNSEQPSLSWFMSKPTKMRFDFLLIDEEGIDPILELTLDASKLKSGIQSLNLADHGVKLEPGVQYQWSVVLVPDVKHRSSDIVSSGMIERKSLESAVISKLSSATSNEDAFIYASEGYWYDAVAVLSGLIEKDPANETLKRQRASLLQQAGLPAQIQ